MTLTHYTVMMEQQDLTTRSRTVATLAHARTIARRWRKAGQCSQHTTIDVVPTDADGRAASSDWTPIATY